VASSGPRSEGRSDRVDFVFAGEDRHEGGVPSNERHFLRDEVADDDAVVLLAEGLEVGTDDGGRNAQVLRRERKSLSSGGLCGRLWVDGPVRAIDVRGARDARAHAVGIAGSHRVICDGRTRCGRGSWRGGAAVAPKTQLVTTD